MKHLRFPFLRSLPAQAMVEFTLAIALFLALVMGIMEMGYFMFSYSSVFTAAREAARFGSSVGLNAAGVPHEKDCDGIRQAAMQLGAYAGITPSDIDIRYDHGPTDTRPWASLPTCESNPQTQLGDRIAVHIAVVYSPLVVGILPGVVIQNTNERTIIKSADIAVDFPTPYPVYYTPTATPTPTDTPTPTATLTPTETPDLTDTSTPTPTTTLDSTDTPTPTITLDSTDTSTPTNSPAASVTPSATPEPTPNPD